MRSPRPRIALGRALAGTLLLGTLLAAVAGAQSFREIEYLEDDGLPSVQIFDIDQGPDGLVLLATRNGLVRFDGREWSIDEDLKTVVPELHHIEVTPAGRVFAAGFTLNRPFGLREPGEAVWTALPPPSVGSAGRIVGFEAVGRDSKDLIVATLDAHLLRWRAGEWSECSPPPALGIERFHALGTHGDALFVATDRGLYPVVEDGWGSALEIGPQERGSEVQGLSHSRAGDPFWIVGQNWLARAGPAGKIEVVSRDFGVAVTKATEVQAFAHGFTSVVGDGFGGAFFGFASSLLHFDEKTGRVNSEPIPSGYKGATQLFRCRDDNIWIGCDRSLRRIPSLRFANYFLDQGVEVTSIIEPEPGRLILATHDGVSVLEGGVWTPIEALTKECFSPHWIIDMALDREGRLWLALGVGGLARLDPDGSYHRISAPGGALLDGQSVFLDRQGVVWTTTSAGPARLEGAEFVLERGDALGGFVPRRLRELADGRKYLATRAGLFVERDDQWQRFRHSELDGANETVCACLDPDGHILVGTHAGLFVAREERLERVELGHEQLSEPVYSITSAAPGVLWFGLQDGVARWDGSRLERFGVDQGLAGYETNRSAALVDSEGQFWIGMVGGASCYRARYDRGPGLPPLLDSIRVEVQGVESDPRPVLALAHDAGDPVFHFRAISFVDSGRVEYACRLDGYDKEWLSGSETASGQLRFTNLPSGRYHLEMRARSAGGVWSEIARSQVLAVAGPYWQSRWFLALVVIALAIIGWGVSDIVYERRRSGQLGREVRAQTAELRETERRFRGLFEKSFAPQLILDSEARAITGANQAAAVLYELSVEELSTRRFDQLRSPKAGQDPLRIVTGEQAYTDTHRTAKGVDILVEVHLSTYEEGERYTIQAIIQDVTERRRLQDQLFAAQRLESVGLLAGGIAHDFNNLLTVVLSNAEMALDELGGLPDPPSSLRQGIMEIRESGLRAAAMTRQLLSFSRRQVAVPCVVNMNEVLLGMEQMIRRLTHDSVSVSIETFADLDATLVDPVQLQQVIMNLVVNANDAMPSGGTLSIRTENMQLGEDDLVGETVPPGAFVALTVSDSGEGIADELRAHIFDPFFSTKAVGQGTGLGLATVHGVVSQAGGLVQVQAAQRVGATFEVFLPSCGPGVVSPPEPAEERTPEPVHAGEAILLCEDDEGVRILALRVLELNGYRVHACARPSLALSLLEDPSVSLDLLITDLAMPEMNGTELASRARRQRPELPMLFISGYPAEFELRGELAKSEVELLQKPFRPRELLGRVREILESHAQGPSRPRDEPRGERELSNDPR